jgi:hypothetical protein
MGTSEGEGATSAASRERNPAGLYVEKLFNTGKLRNLGVVQIDEPCHARSDYL